MQSVVTYSIGSEHFPGDLNHRLASFLGRQSFVIDRFRKNRHKEIDLRPLVVRLEWTGQTLALALLYHQGQPGTNPREMLEKVCGLSARQALLAKIIKTNVEELSSPS